MPRLPSVLTFVTLDTGHIHPSHRGEVDPVVMDLLAPMVDARGGPVPGWPEFRMDFAPMPVVPGTACFQLARVRTPDRPLVICAVGWEGEMAGMIWRSMYAVHDLCQPVPPMPAFPWLVVKLTKHLVDDPVRFDYISTFADLERCIAWTIIDAETA